MILAADVRAALERSHFASLPPEVIAQLTSTSVRVDVAAGADLIPPHGDARLLLVVAGVGKTYLIAPSGRQVTVRYARAGDIIAADKVFDPRPQAAASCALTTMAVLIFHMDTVRSLATTDVRVANVFNVEMAARMRAYFAELAGTAFGSLRERVARHLLDVASEQQRGTALIARISQQELADAVGSVREVVARVLGKLREDGLVRSGDRGIELLDPARLAAEAAPGLTNVTRPGDIGH